MPTFREILTAGDTELARMFYRVKTTSTADFRKAIDHAAAQLGLNHTQLVCALGFNPAIRELTDILSLIGFSSYKLLTYRRNELFATDAYHQLDIDNVIDIYTTDSADAELLETLRELLPRRLANIENELSESEEAATMISYKMEVHALYSGAIATPAFAAARIATPIAGLRQRIGEVQMIVAGAYLAPTRLFVMDTLMPEEKRYLVEAGYVDAALVAARLANADISEDERQMLEDYA
ncbi:MAG: hypothetical protein WD928_11880 [Gammaproteobacteria bacterium]